MKARIPITDAYRIYGVSHFVYRQALRYVIKFAYIAAMEHYLKIEELLSRHGIADVDFIPKRISEGSIGQIK